MSDPLDGFRAAPIPEEGLQVLAMLAGDEDLEFTQAAIRVAQACRDFLDTDIGRYIEAQVNQAEQAFLEAAKQGHIDDQEVRERHFEYLVAVQSMLWIGNMVVEGEEALAQYESALLENEEATEIQ